MQRLVVRPLRTARTGGRLAFAGRSLEPDRAGESARRVRGASVATAADGDAAQHEDVHVLTVQPVTTWLTENVAAVYESLAQRHRAHEPSVRRRGELHYGAEVLKKSRPDTIVLDTSSTGDKRAEVNRRRRPAVRGFSNAHRPHAIGDSTIRTRAPGSSRHATEGPVHESRRDAALGDDDALAARSRS